ncbi:tRNA(Ser) Um(44) 2'-O-methyltransferase [Basidiobolus ranarum]|uniref:tRNA (uracil-O(2)-)-methyltransferase n=1 Tax=Basidiobolus ranarum TaxID=34480 RepID=A0ABR2W3W4_9FUNG
MNQWTLQPELVIPPIKEAKCVSEEREDDGNFQVTRVLIPKRKLKDAELTEVVEFVETDNEAFASFTPRVQSDKGLPFYYPKVEAFRYRFINGHVPEIRFEIRELPGGSVFDEKMKYAVSQLMKKLFKWGISTALGYQKRVHHDIIVPKDMYLSTYERLKMKYAKRWVDSWPEKTDPRKFVYEDIAIATWLVCVWELEREATSRTKYQTFVDIGCGNGLLVHLLNEEGYSGYGIDQSSRKVWSLFGENTKLVSETLLPNEFKVQSEWIIGNHADELVPWIPIIAARSSYDTKFVIIPCCLFELSGKKFVKKVENQGRFHCYLEYLKELVDICGYEVEVESLRIPSTKNVAIIGRKRNFALDDELANEKTRERINGLIEASEQFVPRISDREKEVLRRSKLEKRKRVLSPEPVG